MPRHACLWLSVTAISTSWSSGTVCIGFHSMIAIIHGGPHGVIDLDQSLEWEPIRSQVAQQRRGAKDSVVPRGSCDIQELLIHINVYALQKSHSSNCV
jgi:hypothetical protein